MRATIYPLPNTPSWRGAQLKKSTGTTLPFYLYNVTIIFSSYTGIIFEFRAYMISVYMLVYPYISGTAS
jgi:hypothetical protein